MRLRFHAMILQSTCLTMLEHLAILIEEDMLHPMLQLFTGSLVSCSAVCDM